MAAGKNQAQPVVLEAVLFIGASAELDCASRYRTSSSCDASNLARRRRVSMALNRAVEINHGRGLPGTPLAGHALSAAAKASCIASSARSKSPSKRIRVARIRPRIHAIKGVEQFAYLLGGMLGHDDDLSKPATPNQFGKRNWGLCFESKLCTHSFSPYCTSQSYAFKSPATDDV